MRAFRDISIKQKLTLIIMVTSNVAVLVACVAFVINDMTAFRRSMPGEVSILAQVIGANSTAALMFDDRRSAEETLAALSAQPHIVSACIYGKDGKAAARYMRRGEPADLPWPKPEDDGYRFENERLHLFRQIVLDAEPIGTVYLQYDLDEIRSRGKQSSGIVAVILVATSCLAFLLSSRLQRVISIPILHLADVARAVSRERSYSIRATKHGQDEVGVLIDGFNEMLTQVQDRDAKLELHREHLEEQVAIRTAELWKANQELTSEMTERRLTEKALASEKERLAVTLRSIGDGVIVTDLEGKIVLASKVAEELTGWAQEQAMGRLLREVFRLGDPGVNNFRADPVEEVLETGGIVSHPDPAPLTTRDGTQRIMVYNGAPIREKNGEIIGVILAFRDVTEKQKVEEELLRSRKLESIGILAGGIAHDFNNFLTAILGNISLATMPTAPREKIYQRLTEAERACLRARDLTQQLLTFSKGGAPIKKSASIAEILRYSASFTLAGSNVKCDFSLPDTLWPVEIDEGQISQVINNLIINACQAMPKGGVVRLQAENLVVGSEDPSPLKPGPYVMISIEDQGSGIPEEHRQKIFDPYFTTKEKGTGLGLATCYSIVKRHDGLITAESRVEEGTTFHVTLPALQEMGVLREKCDTSGPLVGKGRILVMDDEEMVRDVAGEILKYIGYEVGYAMDGAEAIEKYLEAKESGQPYDLALMDLTIPGGMGGGEAIQKLLALDGDVKAIVSSGYAHDPVMADYKKWGFCGVVTKPYKIAELSKVLHEVTAGKGK